MFATYTKIAIRNLARHKTFLLLNTIGLVVGIAVCLLILNYTTGERSVDKFHKHSDLIYRIQDDHYANNGLSNSRVFSYPALGPAIKSEYPMVRDVVRMYPVDEAVMDYKGVQFKEEKIYFTEPSFFSVFSFPQIEGNPSSMLNTPNSIVLTRSVAKRYFGNESALGKIITMRIAVVRLSLLVTGIMEDPPKNSHLQFSSLISYSTMHDLAGPDLPETSWSWAQIITYILLAPGTDPKVLELQLPGFMDRHTGKAFMASHEKDVLSLQPLKDIYLHSAVGCEFDRHGSSLAVYSLSVIAVFILVIAWINYINLTTARGIYRAKEVGVKKVLGASRIQLIYQFLLESAVLNFMAIVLGIGVYALTLPFFNNIMGRIGYPEINIWLTYSFWIALISILILGSLISGLYPAFVLSSFNPSRVFKSKSANPRKFNLRQALVVFQFGISVGLVTATFIVFRQINFMRNKNLGINLSNTIVINPPIVKDVDSIRQIQVSILINELKKIPLVEKVSFAASIPGKPLGVFSGVIRQVGSSLSDAQSFKINMVDEQYFELFRNTFVAGRNFNKDFGTNKNAVVINEAASTLLGFRTPNLAINKEIFFPMGGIIRAKIVGVIRNYNHQSLRTGFEPTIFGCRNTLSYCIIRINSPSVRSDKDIRNQIKGLLTKIEKVWSGHLPGNSFSYLFLDQFFDQQYKNDEQFGNLFGIFACIAIVVACLGLLGLASFVTLKRTKEIGIRKVLGAGNPGILLLLSADFIKLIVIASLISLPLAGYIMYGWLQQYAFRIPLSWWLFSIPAVLVLVLAILTISYQAFRAAAGVNPAKSLRTE